MSGFGIRWGQRGSRRSVIIAALRPQCPVRFLFLTCVSRFVCYLQAARRDQINAFMRYHKADSIQMLVSASLSGVLVHDAKHLGYVADLLDSCGLMRVCNLQSDDRTFIRAY